MTETTKATKPELMTVKETAEYLRIPLPTVYYLIQQGQLPAVQFGGRWRVKKDLVDEMVRKGNNPSEAEWFKPFKEVEPGYYWARFEAGDEHPIPIKVNEGGICEDHGTSEKLDIEFFMGKKWEFKVAKP